MNTETLKNVLEVLIMVSDIPLPTDKLCALVDHDDISAKEVNEALALLVSDYNGRGIELKKVSRGYRFQARSEYQLWFHKLFSERPARYSRALLETLAIIAYRQPVTRADVEAIRGVAVSTSIMRTLLEREWVKVVGHRDVPGKPSIYATTKMFLDYFNIARLDDLPPLSEVKELAAIMEQGERSEIQIKQELRERQDEANSEFVEQMGHTDTVDDRLFPEEETAPVDSVESDENEFKEEVVE